MFTIFLPVSQCPPRSRTGRAPPAAWWQRSETTLPWRAGPRASLSQGYAGGGRTASPSKHQMEVRNQGLPSAKDALEEGWQQAPQNTKWRWGTKGFSQPRIVIEGRTKGHSQHPMEMRNCHVIQYHNASNYRKHKSMTVTVNFDRNVNWLKLIETFIDINW